MNRLISAAQVFTHLVTNSHQKPDHETQVRPLIGLTPEQAQLAWEQAVEKAGGRRVTARLVKSAVKKLQPGSPTLTLPKPAVGPTKSERRQLIKDAFGELPLLSPKVSHDILTEKVEKLHGDVQGLFSAAAKRTGSAAE